MAWEVRGEVGSGEDLHGAPFIGRRRGGKACSSGAPRGWRGGAGGEVHRAAGMLGHRATL